jgi:hypothetical protein
MRTLTEIFAEIGNNTGKDIGCNDKGGIHTYLETYDKLFAPFQKGCTIMEIGLAMGDSIKLWDEYFENTVIVGVDISIVFQVPVYKNDVKVIELDATKLTFGNIFNDNRFDIIIDDGSHMEADQIASFNLLKSKMKPGGIYIMEDILALDQNRHRFEALHDNCEIIDMRSNGRFDNVLIIYRF